ncbi:GspH/FimT family pseudopilin [Sedimenticola sp.]|uniref:GspH/FimT family pseudopilin n=1 Tax=Sedimenticola sp. TaxID=1940285 RepID=UPI003D106030
MAANLKKRSRLCRSQSGITLTELIMALGVGTILTTMAIPAFSTILEEDRILTQVYEFVGQLSYARHTAITQGREINLCKSNDGETCNSDLEWKDGWIIYADTSSDHKRSPDETLLRVHHGTHDKITIHYKAGFGQNNYVAYNPLGNTSYNGTFTFCANSNEVAPRAVIIYRGRARLSRRKANGKPLECP